MGKRRNYAAPIVIMALILVLILAFNMGLGAPLGLDPSLTPSLVAVVPGVFLFVVCLVDVAYTQSGSPAKILGVACIGISLAVLLGEMHGVGMFSDAMLLPATLVQCQAILIVFGLLMGGAVYASGG